MSKDEFEKHFCLSQLGFEKKTCLHENEAEYGNIKNYKARFPLADDFKRAKFFRLKIEYFPTFFPLIFG